MTHRALVVVLATLLASAACDRSDRDGDATIRIGLAGPMEASYGQSVREGAELAIAHANAGGGVRGGRRVELVVRDDEADPSRAIDVATELVADPSIVAVVGHVNSGTTRAASRIYNRAGGELLEISPTATSAELTGAGPWTFRVCATDLRHGPALAAWARELGHRRAAVLYANDAYGRGMLSSFASAFRNAGGTIVSDDPYLSALVDSVDLLRPYLDRALARRVDVLMVAGELDVALPALQLARSMGFTGPLMGGDGLLGLEEEAPNATSVYISTGFLPDQPGEAAQRFVAAYREQYGTLPTGDAALAYDAATIVLRAIDEVGGDRRAVRDFVAEIGQDRPPFQGVTGTIAFDRNGDVVNKEVAVGTIRDGRLVSARARRPGS